MLIMIECDSIVGKIKLIFFVVSKNIVFEFGFLIFFNSVFKLVFEVLLIFFKMIIL